MSHPLEKYTEIRGIVVDGEPEARTVWLKVGGQSFCVTPYYADNLEEAEWIRDQLCTTLERLVSEVTEKA